MSNISVFSSSNNKQIKDELFNSLYERLNQLVERRKTSWELGSILEWQDVRSILLTRLWEKIDMYDKNRPLDNWANTVISNALTSLVRQHWYKFARPCVSAGEYGGKCVFALPNGGCSKTPTGKQDSNCPMYAAWQRKKEPKLNVATPLPLENYVNENHAAPEEVLDIEGAKKHLDEKILEKLNSKHERQLYIWMFIEHLSMEEIGIRMKYKTQRNSKVAGYQVLLKFSRKVKDMAKEIIQEDELI